MTYPVVMLHLLEKRQSSVSFPYSLRVKMLLLRDRHPDKIAYGVIKLSCYFCHFPLEVAEAVSKIQHCFSLSFYSSTSGFYCVAIAPQEVFMHYSTKSTMYFLNFLQKMTYKYRQICLTPYLKLNCGLFSYTTSKHICCKYFNSVVQSTFCISGSFFLFAVMNFLFGIRLFFISSLLSFFQAKNQWRSGTFFILYYTDPRSLESSKLI